MKKKGPVLLLLGVLALAVEAGFWKAWQTHSTPPIFPDPAMQVATLETVGSKEARVVVTAFIPKLAACAPSMRLIQAFHSLESIEPSRVRVEIFHAGHHGVQVEMQKRGLREATVLVNNRTEWSLKENGQERNVSLRGVPGVFYQPADVIRVMDQALTQEYGHGFSPDHCRRLLHLVQNGKVENFSLGSRKPPASTRGRLTVEVFLPPPKSPAYLFLQPTLEAIQKWERRYPQQLEVVSYRRYDQGVQRSLQARGLTNALVILHNPQGRSPEKKMILKKKDGQPEPDFQVTDLEKLFQQYLEGSPSAPGKSSIPP